MPSYALEPPWLRGHISPRYRHAVRAAIVGREPLRQPPALAEGPRVSSTPVDADRASDVEGLLITLLIWCAVWCIKRVIKSHLTARRMWKVCEQPRSRLQAPEPMFGV